MRAKEEREAIIKKYFWEQKKKEFKDLFLVLIGIYGIVGIFLIISSFLSFKTHDFIPFRTINFIIGVTPLVFWVVYGIRYWINSNWKQARERLEREEWEEERKDKKK